jgi:hypothetical protein
MIDQLHAPTALYSGVESLVTIGHGLQGWSLLNGEEKYS